MEFFGRKRVIEDGGIRDGDIRPENEAVPVSGMAGAGRKAGTTVKGVQNRNLRDIGSRELNPPRGDALKTYSREGTA